MANTPTKPWTKPVLIVLVRGAPEEMVLAVCKEGNIYGRSNVDRWGGCYAEPYGECPNACNLLVAS